MSALSYPAMVHESDLEPRHYDGIVKFLSGLPGVEKVVLYGSRARGTHRYNSDVDLLLIGEGLGYQTRADALRLLYDLWIPHGFDIMIDEWLKDPLLIEEIARDGVVLWEAPRSETPIAPTLSTLPGSPPVPRP